MSRNFFRCPWWTGYFPWTPNLSVSSLNPQVNWRPSYSLRPSPASSPNSLGVPWSPQPSCWIHVSNLNMASKSDEPLPKRKRTREEEHVEQKPKSSSPTKDIRVPPLHAPPGPPPTAKHSAAVKGVISRRWEDFNLYYSELSKWNRVFGRDPEYFDFTVLSYNILSQDLLEDNSHLYDHCRRPLLFWSYRLPNILKELVDLNADILCLQEVQEDHYTTQIKPSLESLGYHCEYKTRTGSKPDGCAICFKANKFSLVSVTPVEYYRPNISLLDRDNIGLVLLLRPKSQRVAPVICVANTHLLYNPRRGDIKLAQLAILLAEITSVAFTGEKGFCPIVLCGDFNSVPGSPLHSFIREGRLNYEGLSIGKVSGQEQYPRGQKILSIPIWPKSLGISQNCVYEPMENAWNAAEMVDKESVGNSARNRQVEPSLSHHFSLSSVYTHFFPGSGIPEITTCHSRCALTVDYIFYSAAANDLFAQLGTNSSQNGLQLLGRLSLLTEQDLWSVNGLPNETNSSDHLSLLAKFRLEI
ncbi:hypothetical protein XENTR_v10013290 [Xenopus tropicalis]|uniref:Angel homolog 2 n=1 Tax=Xenopus tropicalis TaxID=8364 RepID=L7N3G0_XENTR|nr:protein angel homolog 2 [Xenopus tropicalis]KAE8600513.1 hypothetical protein XENTR_v10013290 [Xenopus tropicalis]KAE8600514.1 hypothetical protein XENTR_v10013290 [Xenopus tropicalis]